MEHVPYVCAFRGRRDDYQVPRALAERGQLESFITDAYAGPLLRKAASAFQTSLTRAIDFRSSENIPDGLVKCLWGTTAWEHFRHRVGISPALTYAKLDQVYSKSAAAEARETRSNLFLYTPYAWEAFCAKYHHTPRKILFEYHPHPATESRILEEDFRRCPEVQHSYLEATGGQLPEKLRLRISDAWKMADLILCASSFTKQTVVSAGANPAMCVVIPYGVKPSNFSERKQEDLAKTGSFKALFVGSGVQRKGLHHLLRAWKMARLPKDSSLTLVCRNLDPGLEKIAADSPRTRLIRGTTAASLANLYRASTLFVMPSLVEGFGQVYLEAMSYGCPVLGTANTCLPDIGTEIDGIFLVEPKNIEQLTSKLEDLSAKLTERHNYRESAQACSIKHSWSQFRRGIQKSLCGS